MIPNPTLALRLLMGASGFLAIAPAMSSGTNGLPEASGGQEVLVHAHLEARLEASNAGRDQLRLEVDGKSLDLNLRDNASLLASLPQRARAQLETEGRYLEGEIVGIPGSWVRLNEVDGRYSGAYFDGAELMLLDPLQSLHDSLPAGTATRAGNGLVVYRMRDIEMPGLIDEVVSVPGYALKQAPTRLNYARFAQHLDTRAGPELRKNAVRQLRLTVVADTEFSSVHGGNRAAVVASRVNVVDGIYSSQFQTRIVLGEVRFLSTNGTLNTTIVSGEDTLLSRFRSYMASGDGRSIPKGGLNHLFSGKDFEGNTVGVAYLNTLCSTNYGYGINQVRAASTTTALTIAHEMGHNFGASHDGQSGSVCASQTGSWLMSPSLNGSTTFSPCSRTSMEPRIRAATCMEPLSTATGIFENGFE